MNHTVRPGGAGDILLLETGDMVAADGRLLEVYGLTVNESSLTGESLGVEKHTGAVKAREEPWHWPDRTNMVFSGSLVTSRPCRGSGHSHRNEHGNR
ncbi:MAG: hypothetical protein ACLTW9_05150 [Enterocloster sp.]